MHNKLYKLCILHLFLVYGVSNIKPRFYLIQRTLGIVQTLQTYVLLKIEKSYRQYDFLIIGEKKKLIEKRTDFKILYVLPLEELFDCIHRAHNAIGHKGRDLMLSECSKKYSDITVDFINIFIVFCVQCQLNKARKQTTGVVSKVILSKDFNARAQMDLVDMQSEKVLFIIPSNIGDMQCLQTWNTYSCLKPGRNFDLSIYTLGICV